MLNNQNNWKSPWETRGGEEAVAAEATVGYGRHTHWSFFSVSSSSSSSIMSVPTLQIKLLTGREEVRGWGEQTHYWGGGRMEGCHKECVRAQTFSVNVCVGPYWTVYDDTFPLCLLRAASKRHLRHSLTLNSIYSFLWEFTASALNSQSNYPVLFKHTHTHTSTNSPQMWHSVINSLHPCISSQYDT